MLWNALKKISNNKEFLEGGRVNLNRFKYPFRQDFQLMVNMFEVRQWFTKNTPHTHYGEKYTQ